jgi:hypothetical protein
MRRNIPKPTITPNFTINDIHKIREWNYECQRDIIPEERVTDTARRGKEALARLGLANTI